MNLNLNLDERTLPQQWGRVMAGCWRLAAGSWQLAAGSYFNNTSFRDSRIPLASKFRK